MRHKDSVRLDRGEMGHMDIVVLDEMGHKDSVRVEVKWGIRTVLDGVEVRWGIRTVLDRVKVRWDIRTV